MKSIKSLTKAAEIQPHLACVSLTESLQNEWGYMQTVVANLEKPFALLKTTIEHSFLPALFQSDVEQVESSLMMLSCCNFDGGLGICDSVATYAIVSNLQ